MSAVEDWDDIDPDPPIADEVGPDGKPFRVHDLASADWAMRKLAKYRTRYAEAKAFAEAEADRTRAWLQGERNELDRAEDFFGGLLEAWHADVLEHDARRKTIKLPSGELRARKLPDRVIVADPDAFVCAQGFDSPLVTVKATPNLAAVKNAVLHDGEALPGVEVVVGEVRFTAATEAPIEQPYTPQPGDPF